MAIPSMSLIPSSRTLLEKCISGKLKTTQFIVAQLRIGTIMEQIFPEYEKQFSSRWLSTSMGILEKYLTPKNIKNAPIDELFKIIKDKSHNKLTIQKAISIKEAATDTLGIKIAQDAFSFQLKQLIDRINFLDKQIETLDTEIMKYYEQFDCYLHTIPGLGMIAAATTCSFHNSPLNAYYKKKRNQGKHHLTATGAVARKLTTVIYAVLRDGKPYEPKKF